MLKEQKGKETGTEQVEEMTDEEETEDLKP